MPVALERFANDFATTLSAGASSGGATISVAAAAPASLQGAGQFRIKVDDEIMVVTSGAATTTWSVSRGAESTTAASHSSGAAVTHVLTQGALERWVPEYVWQPQHHGLLAWTGDPIIAWGGGTALAGGVIQTSRMWVPETVTVANLVVSVLTAGATLTAGQNFGGLYDSNGVLIAKTTDQSSAWTSTGLKAMALTAEAGQSLTLRGGPGVWVRGAVLSNGTTKPAMQTHGAVAITVGEAGLAAPNFRFSSVGSGQTAMPSTLGAQTAQTVRYWMGLS